MRIAISGASGHIGSALAAYLEARGDEVHRLVRREPIHPNEVRWDPHHAAVDSSGLERLDAVVHLAGENVGQRWNEQVKEEIKESRRLGTRLLAETLAELDEPPRVLVSQSAAGYYGQGGERTLHEDDPPGEGFLSEVCQAWEAAADPAREAGIRVVHPRPMLVLSADGPPLAKLISIFRMGVGGPIGGGDMWWSWILREDFVRLVHHVIGEERVHGAVNAATPAPVRMRDFSKALGEALRRPAVMPTPAFALKAMYREMADEVLLASQRLGVSKIMGSGFEFHHPHIQEALEHEVGRAAAVAPEEL